MSDGYIGIGYLPRCPGCGSATVVEDDQGERRVLLCATCGQTHVRDARGRLIEDER